MQLWKKKKYAVHIFYIFANFSAGSVDHRCTGEKNQMEKYFSVDRKFAFLCLGRAGKYFSAFDFSVFQLSDSGVWIGFPQK